MRMNNYKWTLFGIALALFLWAAISLLHIDIFETINHFINSFEHHQLDEIIVLLIIVYIFVTIDMACLLRKRRIQSERFKIYTKMVKAMQHVLNNFLQKMMAVQITVEQQTDISQEAKDLYNQIIDETVQQIDTLGSIEKPDEDNIEEAIRPREQPDAH